MNNNVLVFLDGYFHNLKNSNYLVDEMIWQSSGHSSSYENQTKVYFWGLFWNADRSEKNSSMSSQYKINVIFEKKNKKTSLDFNYVKPCFDLLQFRYNFITLGQKDFLV